MPRCANPVFGTFGRLYRYSRHRRFKCGACGVRLVLEPPEGIPSPWKAKLLRSNIGIFVLFPVGCYLILIAAAGAMAIVRRYCGAEVLFNSLLLILGVWVFGYCVGGVKRALHARLLLASDQGEWGAFHPYRMLYKALKEEPAFRGAMLKFLMLWLDFVVIGKLVVLSLNRLKQWL